VEATLERAMETYEVVEVACDPPGWHREMEEWQDTYGQVVVEFATNQPKIMVPACDRFRSAVLEGGLTHDGDATLARHVANCAAKESSSGTVIATPAWSRARSWAIVTDAMPA
jgi:phage terminase large subunit-like protein